MSPFKRNLLIGYGVSLVLLTISAIASFISIRNLLANTELVNHTNDVIKSLEEVMLNLKEAEAGQRGYLLTGNERFLSSYKAANQNVQTSIDNVQNITLDNSEQQSSLVNLKKLIEERLFLLQQVIDKKNTTSELDMSLLEAGRMKMEALRNLILQMENREKVLLKARTDRMNRFAASTPTFIVVASILSILVTIVSFLRVNKDYENRTQLQNDLQQKDIEITERLNIIQGIAEKVSSGDYKTRITDEGKDVLGSLSFSLNKMAESLDYSFSNLSDKEWMQTGIAQLNELMIGETNLDVLSYNVIEFVTRYTQSPVGAFYLTINGQILLLSASIGLDKQKVKNSIAIGEGIAGQSALSGKEIYLENINDAEMLVDFTGGSLKPKSLIAIPIYHEKKLKGVMELATLKGFTNVVHEFLKSAAFNIGIAIHSARDHERLQELLAETQAQSEELQSQHSELENINAELESQSERLQTSEEELRVQQEELQQANQELEERSRLLEEKNELILERNLDIQRKAEELEISTQYKSEFLANMSHELRTPLNSILLLSRLLSENHGNNLSGDQVEYANVIQSSGKGLLTLIDEILDLSKIESGKMEPELSEVSIQGISQEINSLFNAIAKEKNLDFHIKVEKNAPAIIETDKLRLEQILRNLISNALKFTKKGSVELKISKEDSLISFAVKDTGIGIPKEKQHTIFEAFQQADGSTRRQYGGTGLGLSISRELAKLLGGEIRLVSNPGEGSVFTLLLPVENVKSIPTKTDVPKPTEEEPVNKNLTTQEKGPNYLSEKIPSPIPDDRTIISKGDKVILIIEDDTAFARSLLDYTRAKGYKGVVAVRGDEGVELAKQFLPTGILLDVQLPVKSGWEVMEELKANPDTRPIPVHMMSSHEVKNKSLSKGAVDFINKPVAFEQLGEIFQKIENALSRHPKKVLIVEENTKHAQALAYFLESYNVATEIRDSINEGVKALSGNGVDCVILDMGIPAQRSYDILEDVKKSPGLENLPIIVFTGKNLSHVEEMKIKQYADSIVVKTAHSYERILDEVSLFLHLVEDNKKQSKTSRYKKMGELSEVLKGKTILIADDDVRNIFSLTKSLENFGIKVLSAIDGKEALKQLQEKDKVDLVLMDMMMPEMDGYESTKRIRSIPKYKALPIIAVTAKAMTGDREKCIAAGASDYITKPVDIDQLISLLRVWLYGIQ